MTKDNIKTRFIGSDNINSTNWQGQIGEIIIYNKALSDENRIKVEKYLMDKWDI